jgi:hypothetical protein
MMDRQMSGIVQATLHEAYDGSLPVALLLLPAGIPAGKNGKICQCRHRWPVFRNSMGILRALNKTGAPTGKPGRQEPQKCQWYSHTTHGTHTRVNRNVNGTHMELTLA